jgi:hypothetical protein
MSMLNTPFQTRWFCQALMLLGVLGACPAAWSLAGEPEHRAPQTDSTSVPSEPDYMLSLPTDEEDAVLDPSLSDKSSPAPPPSEEATPAQPPTTDSAPPQQESERAATPVNDTVNPSIKLRGLVWRAKPGIVFLKTPIGLMSLSSKSTLKSLPGSQEVVFWVHDAHLVVDLVKRADRTLVHRYVSGPFKRDDHDAKKLVYWTPEGEKAFQMGAYERMLATHHDGDTVTVEVDGTGAVIGVHDLQFDLQIGQIPPSGSDAHLLLTGTISKLKSNFIFFRTPIGIINVNAKIGIKNAKVGQTMTLHMHDHHLVADLSAANGTTPTHRFLTGPLEFADSARSSVRLWTPDGEQTYPADIGKAALAGVKAGSPITLELNGQGNVVEFHRMK